MATSEGKSIENISSQFGLHHVINDIEKIIQNLHPNKAHNHYKISISMIKICGKSVFKSLQLSLIKVLMEKCQNSPVHKKVISNVCGEILEKLIFNEMFRFLIENNFISLLTLLQMN